ncbi:MAG: hypothetical protein DME86_09125, partial [Verrucomicrobia bacterium]
MNATKVRTKIRTFTRVKAKLTCLILLREVYAKAPPIGKKGHSADKKKAARRIILPPRGSEGSAIPF